MKPARKARHSNAGKLREASRIAMHHAVVICIDAGELKTISLHPWCQTRTKPAERVRRMREEFEELGTFRAMPGETRYAVFLRMWEEAEFAGALLGAKPDEGWVCGAMPHTMLL